MKTTTIAEFLIWQMLHKIEGARAGYFGPATGTIFLDENHRINNNKNNIMNEN